MYPKPHDGGICLSGSAWGSICAVTIHVDAHIVVHNYEGDNGEVIAAINRLASRIVGLGIGVEAMALDLSAVEREVSENTDAVDSASTLMGALAQELRDAAGDPAAVQALADRLDANTAKLAAAVVANTPSAPAGGTGAGGTGQIPATGGSENPPAPVENPNPTPAPTPTDGGATPAPGEPTATTATPA